MKSKHPCHLLPDFDDPQIESICVKVRPHRLPRGTSTLLIGTVYHPPSSSAEQNPLLISHIQRNIEAFLNSCPDGLAIVSGDFNPPSTRIKSADVTMATGLRQMSNFPHGMMPFLTGALPTSPISCLVQYNFPRLEPVITMRS